MLTEKLLKIYKSNELNEGHFKDLGLSTYRVFLTIVSKIKRYDENGVQIKNIATNREYALSISEYAKQFNISENTAYKALKDVSDKLMDTKHTLKEINKKGKVKWAKINLCSKAWYVEGEGKINIRFTEEIMPYLTELNSCFTVYNLREIIGFKSLHTTRMYELLMQYKHTGKLEISVQSLRESLDCVNTHKLYADFKRSGFGHAVNEINSKYDINIKFKEIKVGRSVDRIEFIFRKTKTDQVYDPVTKKVRNQLTRPKKKKVEKQEKFQEKNPREAFSELAEKLRTNKK